MSDPKAFLGSRTKPRLLSHWLDQSTTNTSAGFSPNGLQGEWLERTGRAGGVLWQVCVAGMHTCVHVSGVTLIET